MTNSIDFMRQWLRILGKAIDLKVEALALKENVGPAFATKSHRGNRVSFGGGEAASFGGSEAKMFEADHSPDGFNFDGESRRNSQRFSMGSSSSQASKDIGTKIERPKFQVEKSKLVDGIKTELVQDSDFINYLDEYDHYIEQWKSVPTNEGLDYPNADKVAIHNMPPKYAKKAADRIHWLYSQSELRFCTLAQAKSAKFWSDITSEQLRFEIGKTAGSEMSSKGILDALKNVKWTSQYGIIDMQAFANFQHEFKKAVMRIESGDVVRIEPIHMKDIIISALPDRQFQLELFSKFGQSGTMLVKDFAINLVFDEIEKYISSISKHGLRFTVNKMNREREGNFGGKKGAFVQGKSFQITADDDQDQDFDDEEFQDQANMSISNYGTVKCRYDGLGSDGKLKCKWLASPEATCLFKHSESDLKQKGKGQSKDVQVQTKHVRKVNMSLLSEEVEAHESNEDDS